MLQLRRGGGEAGDNNILEERQRQRAAMREREKEKQETGNVTKVIDSNFQY
jgi:hypothetical protein